MDSDFDWWMHEAHCLHRNFSSSVSGQAPCTCHVRNLSPHEKRALLLLGRIVEWWHTEGTLLDSLEPLVNQAQEHLRQRLPDGLGDQWTARGAAASAGAEPAGEGTEIMTIC